MIPEGITAVRTDVFNQSSLTFKADFDKNKLRGKTDELEAVRQAVFLLLSTERDYSPVYKNYGVKTVDLIGKDFYFAVSEIKRRIVEVLLEDDRINGVDSFEYQQDSDNLIVKFDVSTVFGVFKAEGVIQL